MEGDRFANRIDMDAAFARGIPVVDTTQGTSYPVSEWALGLTLIALKNALENLGFSGINGVRQGKFIELDLSETNREIIQSEVTDMCEKLIANTVIETYKVEVTD